MQALPALQRQVTGMQLLLDAFLARTRSFHVAGGNKAASLLTEAQRRGRAREAAMRRWQKRKCPMCDRAWSEHADHELRIENSEFIFRSTKRPKLRYICLVDQHNESTVTSTPATS